MGLSDWPGGADPQTAVVLTYLLAFFLGGLVVLVGFALGGVACAL